MPELPEVETVIRDLNSREICGASIISVCVGWPRTVAPRSVDFFQNAVKNSLIEAVTRRGKYIIFELSNDWRMLIHLRMTGKLLLHPESIKPGKHDHVVFTLSDNRTLIFNDTRKFGRITLISDSDPDPISKLGPEPLGRGFSKHWLSDALNARSRRIKPLLLDQSFIAGLGNIYVDEALWAARIHPERVSSTISPAEAELLHRSIRAVLRRGIENCGTTLGSSDTNFYSVSGRRGRNADQLNVFRRTGEPCPVCATRIERIVVGQRGTHFCPQCQQ